MKPIVIHACTRSLNKHEELAQSLFENLDVNANEALIPLQKAITNGYSLILKNNPFGVTINGYDNLTYNKTKNEFLLVSSYKIDILIAFEILTPAKFICNVNLISLKSTNESTHIFPDEKEYKQTCHETIKNVNTFNKYVFNAPLVQGNEGEIGLSFNPITSKYIPNQLTVKLTLGIFKHPYDDKIRTIF